MSIGDPILTIAVASKLLNLHPRTIMLYERIGLMKPHRTGTQRRLYSIKDLNDLQFIKFLTRDKGINLQGVKHLLDAITLGEKDRSNFRKTLFPGFKEEVLI